MNSGSAELRVGKDASSLESERGAHKGTEVWRGDRTEVRSLSGL